MRGRRADCDGVGLAPSAHSAEPLARPALHRLTCHSRRHSAQVQDDELEALNNDVFSEMEKKIRAQEEKERGDEASKGGSA